MSRLWLRKPDAMRAGLTRAPVLLALTTCLACGGSPGSTDPIPVNRLAIRPGPYWLLFTGIGFSLDPDLPACENAISIRGGTLVDTPVDVTNLDGVWVARSATTSGAQIEFTFRESPTGLVEIPINGTIRGTVVDVNPNDPTGVVIAVQGTSTESADVTGHGTTNVNVVIGTVTGRIEFRDARGNVSTCSKIRVDLYVRVP